MIALLGFPIALFCATIVIYSLIEWLLRLNNLPPPGWMTLFVGIYFISEVQLVSIGVLVEYLGQNLTETRKRPSYIIEDINLG